MEVVDLAAQPGPLIRRLQSLHVSIFASVLGSDVTSPQFGLLCVVAAGGTVDQGDALVEANLDRSTGADVAARLHRRGLLLQEVDPADSRRRLLSLTRDGEELLERLMPNAAVVGDRLLSPLDETERRTLMDLMAKVVAEWDDPRRRTDGSEAVVEPVGETQAAALT